MQLRPAPALAELARRYLNVRHTSTALASALSPEDCTVQSMPDASPVKWHLAHTTWFFETFVLERENGPRHRPFHPAFRMLFNSYYNSIGGKHPRAERGLLTRPTLAEVLTYRRHVDAAMSDLLARPERLAPDLRDLVELGMHHEQQHQELILTDIKHLLSRNPLHPAYDPAWPLMKIAARTPAWVRVAGGIHEIGHSGAGFAFDNEGPRHRVLLNNFEMAAYPVSNGEYLEFMADGGYTRPELWLSLGWDFVQANDVRAPLYWEYADKEWRAFSLHGMVPVDANTPVTHISYFEADAYARWAGARLPTEAEWEVFALSATDGVDDGNFQESRMLHPVPPRKPRAAPQAQQVFGDVWEWTSSSYAPYPGFTPAAGAVGEYNGKFMCNQYVLRGGSCVTPISHIRASYRNFFPPDARWQFSGVRVARDA
ncbi:MAG TPA: ergothioneine biosynthesis protein EgtB [Burkholderiaceae bacterium]|nr:ergothioneine biosynthesis protein EgtB [Burkholderiaceae bacterium]